MCGRFVDPKLRGTDFEISQTRIDPMPRRYNIKPTQDVLVVTKDAPHTRLPVILNAEERDAWLAGSDDPEIGAGAQMQHHPVAPFGISDEGDDLIRPLAA